MSAPRVSVCVPVRNGAATLHEALESVLRQTYHSFELLVVDDGSTDATPSILAEYAAADRRMRVLPAEGTGVSAALRQACAKAGGEYLARMDADDIALPDRLERQRAYLDAHPTTAVLGGAYIVLRPSGKRGRTVRMPRSDAEIRRVLPRLNPIAHPTAMMRRDAYEAAGGYRLARAEDYDLWLRIAERWQLANLREPVLLRREHAAQLSTEALDRDVLAVLAASAAARERAAGRCDPLEGVDEPTLELLRQLGIDSTRVRERLIAAYVTRAGALADADGADAALELVRRATELAPERKTSIQTSFALLRARSAVSTGRPLAAARTLIPAAIAHPLATGAALASRLHLPAMPTPRRRL